MSDEQVMVWEGNDPTLHFYVTETVIVNGAEVTRPMPLTGATIEAFLKASPSATDPAAITGTITDATGGLCDVPLTSGQVGSVGRQWLRLDVIKSGKRETKWAGWLITKNG